LHEHLLKHRVKRHAKNLLKIAVHKGQRGQTLGTWLTQGNRLIIQNLWAIMKKSTNYWFHVPPRVQLDNEVLQYVDQPHGTICHQHCSHRTWLRLQAGTEDAPVLDRPAPLKRLRDSGAGYKYPDLLTYSLTYLTRTFYFYCTLLWLK